MSRPGPGGTGLDVGEDALRYLADGRPSAIRCLASAVSSHQDARCIIGPVSTPSGWLVVQRELTGSVRVRDAAEIWFTAVFSTPSRKIVAGNASSSALGSLIGAVRQAIRAPAHGIPPGPPAVVVAAPGLAEQVRDVLREEGIRAGVEEVGPPDWAEDVLTELTGHLAGRVQVADPPTPADWALLHQPGCGLCGCPALGAPCR